MNIALPKIHSIQVLRGVAASLVLLAHLFDEFDTSALNFYSLQNFGACGVDLFFIISGFIISIISEQYAIEKKPFTFLFKRIMRVVPLYWILSFLLLGIKLVLYDSVMDIDEILKTLLFLPILDNQIYIAPILFLGWSLSFELYFYFIVFIGILTQKKYLLFTVLFILASVIVLNSLQLNGVKFCFYGHYLMLEFLMGILVGIAYKRFTNLNTTLLYSVLLSGLFLMLLTIITGYGELSEINLTSSQFIFFKRAVIWGIPSTMIVFGAVNLERHFNWKANKLLLTVGDASYSLYLSHIIIIKLALLLLIKFNCKNFLTNDSWVVLLFIICIGIAILCYNFVEKPLLKITRLFN